MSFIFYDFAHSEKLPCFHSDCQMMMLGLIFSHIQSNLMSLQVHKIQMYFLRTKMVLSSEQICDSARCAKCWLWACEETSYWMMGYSCWRRWENIFMNSKRGNLAFTKRQVSSSANTFFTVLVSIVFSLSSFYQVSS